MMNEMFCFQCEQTAKGTGCTESEVCGKKPNVAFGGSVLGQVKQDHDGHNFRQRHAGFREEAFLLAVCFQ